MNDTTLRPDDPKLTAYALGELSGDERAAVDAALRENPALRSLVEELRATALQLETALATEPLFATEPARTPAPVAPSGKLNGHHVLVSHNEAHDTAAASRPRRKRGKLIRFPQFYFVIGGLAAACFAVFVAVNREAYDTKQQFRETEARIARNRVKASDAASASSGLLVVTVPIERAGEPGEPTTPLALSATEPTPAPRSFAPEPIEPPRTRRSTFLDSNLTLVEQTPAAGGAAASGSIVSINHSTQLPPRGILPGAELTEPFVDTSAAGTPVQPASGIGNSIVTSPATIPSRQPDAPNVQAERLARDSKPADDIVRLDAFTVEGDRIAGARALSMFTFETKTRGMVERRELPRPPVGAQFGRSNDVYAYAADNDFMRASLHPVSTFSASADTASYANVRRYIEQGSLPPRDAVRIEDLLNYFPYAYPGPVASRGDVPPFAASLEVADAPWAPTHRLVRVGLKAREVATADRGPANLVFLLDVSGSMADANKLPLVKESMNLLLGKLRPDDRVAIVVYAGGSGVALQSTPVSKSRQIRDALEALTPGGSTNGGMGIHLAYDIAKANFNPRGINRVILCTDGDFNVGTTGDSELVQLIQEKAGMGVFLTVLGFGMGNLKNATLERLASKGNGNYGYVDSRREAEKLLVEQVSSSLVTVAKDLKIQVEFNPAKVSSYRLIGYENRLLRREDFNNDKVDAGEVGAGHTVTALYEIVPVGAEPSLPEPTVEALKYQAKGAVSSRLEMPGSPTEIPSNEMLTVKVRYKRPDGIVSRSMEFALVDRGAQFANATPDFQFAAAVAQFGMILRDSPHRGSGTIRDVIAWAAKAATNPAADPGRYRSDFVELARKTQKLLR